MDKRRGCCLVALLVFGGSFDPFHIGHLMLALEVKESLGVQEILLVPAAHSPLKRDTTRISDKDRLDMLSAVCASYPEFRLEDCEIKRGGSSYTIDTLDYLGNKPTAEALPYLLLGQDIVDSFSKWRDHNLIAERARIVLARRGPSPWRDFPWPHQRINNAIIEISSSQIRQRIAEGRRFRHLVPSEVYGIIQSRGLYGYRPND